MDSCSGSTRRKDSVVCERPEDRRNPIPASRGGILRRRLGESWGRVELHWFSQRNTIPPLSSDSFQLSLPLSLSSCRRRADCGKVSESAIESEFSLTLSLSRLRESTSRNERIVSLLAEDQLILSLSSAAAFSIYRSLIHRCQRKLTRIPVWKKQRARERKRGKIPLSLSSPPPIYMPLPSLYAQQADARSSLKGEIGAPDRRREDFRKI